jgi:general stress protein CsbA
MTASIIASHKKGYIAVCLAWFTIDFIFELGQGFGNTIISFIPDWFSNLLFLENTKDYFRHGRFDYLDVISIAVGALAAYLFLIRTKLEKEEGA